MLFLIVAPGTIKPDTWTLFIVGAVATILTAIVLTIYSPSYTLAVRRRSEAKDVAKGPIER